MVCLVQRKGGEKFYEGEVRGGDGEILIKYMFGSKEG
jgi:hypothetical protein